MASLFVEPPSWLQQRAGEQFRETQQFGKLAGDIFDHVGVAFQKDPEAPADASWADSRIGWDKAGAVIQENKIDPLWRQNQQIKLSQWALSQKAHNLQNESTKLKIDAQAKLLSDSSTDDQNWNRLQGELGTDPEKWAGAVGHTFLTPQYQKKYLDTVHAAQLSPAIKEHQTVVVETTKQLAKDAANYLRSYSTELTDEDRNEIGAPKGPQGTLDQKQAAMVANKLRAAGKTLPGQKDARPTSPIGKLEADRQRAVDTGAPQEVIDAFDASISKLNASKPGSSLGKLQADRAAAEASGAPKEVLSAYDAAISKQSGAAEKEPRMMQMPNGQTAVWIPGSKGLHILKDQKQDVQAKASYEEWKQALSSLNKARKDSPNNLDLLNSLTGRVNSARKKVDSLFKATDQPPPAASAAPNPSRFTIVPE